MTVSKREVDCQERKDLFLQKVKREEFRGGGGQDRVVAGRGHFDESQRQDRAGCSLTA